MKTAGVVVVAAVGALMGCSQAETPQQMQARMDQESAAFKTAIAGITSRWEGFYAAGQSDSIGNLFTENGRVLNPNGPAAVGRAAIAKQEAENMMAYNFKISILTDEAAANGPLGISAGTFGIEGTAKKGAPKGTPPKMSDHGNYLMHWHNVNGTWQAADLAYTSSWTATPPKPAPVKAPAPAKKPATTRRR